MKIEETIAQEALRLLYSIPKEDFISDRFTNRTNKCCALGHYNRLKSKNTNDYSTKNCSDFTDFTDMIGTAPIRHLSLAFIQTNYKQDKNIVDVNNEPTLNGYTEPEIKDRVIHLLVDMVESGL